MEVISNNTLLNGLFTFAIFSYSLIIGLKLNSIEMILMNIIDNIEYKDSCDERDESDEEDTENEEDNEEENNNEENKINCSQVKIIEPIDLVILQVSKIMTEMRDLKKYSLNLTEEEYDKFKLHNVFDSLDKLCEKNNPYGLSQILYTSKDE